MSIDLLRLGNFTDIIHGTIHYSGLEAAVFDCPLVNRLHRIMQNSLAYITFPSNKVKRFEHSAGVMYLAGMIFLSAVVNTNADELDAFFENIHNELHEWIENQKSNAHANYNPSFFGLSPISIRHIKNRNFPSSSFYDRYIPSNIQSKYRFLYVCLFQGIRLAGLLHDIGHLPYSHTIEKMLKKLFDIISKKPMRDRKPNENAFINCYNACCSSEYGNELHEELGLRMLEQVQSDVETNKIDNTCIDSELALIPLSFIIANKILKKPDNNFTAIYSLHPIISGMIDADRLDYASRDLFCSAISKDIINYERIFMNVSLSKLPSYDDGDRNYNNQFHTIIIKAKAIREVEEVLFKRWRIFRDMVFHHGVHKSEILMMKTLVEDSIKHLNEDNEYTYDHEKIDTALKIPLNSVIEGVLFFLTHMRDDNDLDSLGKVLIQLDDSWVDTALKQSLNKNILSELLSNRKEWTAIYKRFDDFLKFDEMIYNKFKDSEVIEKLCVKAEHKTTVGSGANENINMKELFIFLKDFREQNDPHIFFWQQKHALFCNFLILLLRMIGKIRESKEFLDLLEEKVHTNQDDLLIGGLSSITTGIKITDITFFDSENTRDGDTINLNALRMFYQLSTQNEFLLEEQMMLPTFHLYIKIKSISEKHKLVEMVRDAFFNLVTEYMEEYVDSC